MTATLSRSSDDGFLSPPSDNRLISRRSDNRPLSRLSDDRLLSRLDDLAARERRITLCIVDHLGEVERRELYLAHGYGSMFSYCTGRLRYSASAANRRIRTARCVRRFPLVREALENTRVNLSTVSMVAGIMTEENHTALLARVAGRVQDEVKAIVADYRPRGAVRDTVTPVSVRLRTASTDRPAVNPTLDCEYNRSGGKISTTASPEPVTEVTTETTAEPTTMHSRPGSGHMPTSTAVEGGGSAGRAADNADEPDDTLEKQFIVRFAAGPELMRQIEATRSLLSFRLPAGATMAQVLGAVLGDFIERNDPTRRRERRETRRHRMTVGGEAANQNPRAIPETMRDEVLSQSGGRCEYISDAGRRCDATAYLQVDHIVPVARGGTADRDNLRVLCARHNRTEAKRLLGHVRTTASLKRRRRSSALELTSQIPSTV